jgi:hypothetical protein
MPRLRGMYIIRTLIQVVRVPGCAHSPPKREKNMTVSKLVADFARFVAENRDGAKTVSDLLAEVDSQRDEDNWTPEQLDLVEDEIIVLPIGTRIAQLTE